LLIAVLIMAVISAGRNRSAVKTATDSEIATENLGTKGTAADIPQEIIDAVAGEGMVAGEEKTVEYTAGGFTPEQISVKKGETVSWTNNSGKDMWIASDDHPTHRLYPEFDQKSKVGQGGTFKFTFDAEGVWGYHNHLSPADTGQVTVAL